MLRLLTNQEESDAVGKGKKRNERNVRIRSILVFYKQESGIASSLWMLSLYLPEGESQFA